MAQVKKSKAGGCGFDASDVKKASRNPLPVIILAKEASCGVSGFKAGKANLKAIPANIAMYIITVPVLTVAAACRLFIYF
jgi:hypothetical protein